VVGRPEATGHFPFRGIFVFNDKSSGDLLTKLLPYYKMYPADADTDENFRAMNDEERGFYWRCLNHAWINGGLPVERSLRARCLFVEAALHDKLWERVGLCFEETEDGSRLVNHRQESERAIAVSKREQSSEAGRRSASVRRSLERPLNDRSNGRCQSVRTRASESESNIITIPEKEERTSTTEGVESLSVVQERWFEEEFWPQYWRKVSKKPAAAAFKKHATTEAIKNQIVEAVVAHSPTYLSRQPEHRPHAATWLNEQRYEEPPEDLSSPAIPTKSKFELMMESI
jgi:hypothetical protein